MLSQALEFLKEHLGRAMQFSGEEGGPVYDRPVHRAPQSRPDPTAKPLEVSTLDSVASYVSDQRDSLDMAKHTVHVVGPSTVQVLGPIAGHHRQREVVVRAVYRAPSEPYLSLVSDGLRYLPLEQMVIAVMATVVDTPERMRLLDLLKAVKAEKAEIREDSGTSQKVNVSAGVATLKVESTANPYRLRPQRTFTEVEQPESPFVLRLRDDDRRGIEAALVLADGGAWERLATESVAAYLSAKMAEDGDAEPLVLH